MTLPTTPSSFWLDRRRPLDRLPPLEGRQFADTAVVGAGIVGACVARCLVQQGAQVVLLDADIAGRGATGRNAGFLLAEGAETTAEVARSRGLDTALALRGAGLRTRRDLTWLSGAEDIDFQPTGSLRLAADSEEAQDFEETARRLGSPLRFLARDSIPTAYQRPGFSAALVDPGDGTLNPLKLLDGVLATTSAEASEHGGDFHLFDESPAIGIHESETEVRVDTPRGTVHAARAVVTTNAWINRLLPSGPFVRPVRAQMLAARVDPVPSWDMPVYADHGADYWRLIGDGTVLLGGRRLVGGPTEETDDANPAAPVQPALDALLRRLLGPAARVEVLTRWAGTMGFTADGIPVVGKAPGYSRVWVLGGCNGHGIGWGPGLACMLADALSGRGDAVPACFDPSRPAVLRGSLPSRRGDG